MFNETIEFIRSLYNTKEFIPLHEPRFIGNEKVYIEECIDSTFVSSVGKYVDEFENKTTKYTGASHAIATVNGTAALHIALLLAGVEHGDEVITQPLTFVATCNAINYLGASPVFIDVDKETMGLSPEKLEHFLLKNCEIKREQCYNKISGRRIKAVIPMHTFGLPSKIIGLKEICARYYLNLVEDAAESLGSHYDGQHTGTMGLVGVLSFNGNKIITTGGGGMLLTNNKELAKKAKHLTTTAKVPHQWEFNHDQVGYNYRLPNINAALGCAQMENLSDFIERKRKLAAAYKKFFDSKEIEFVTEPEGTKSNYWLNCIILDNLGTRNKFLEFTNSNGIMTRPIWRLMNHLPMYKNAQTGNLENSEWLEQRAINIPSSIIV